MADEERDLNINIEARDNASDVIDGLAKRFDAASATIGNTQSYLANWASELVKDATATEQASVKTSIFTGILQGVGQALAKVALQMIDKAFTAFPQLIQQSIAAAGEEEVVFQRLQKTLENAGTAWASVNDEIERSNVASMRLGFSEEEAATALDRLVQITGNYKQSMMLLPMAMDLARARGMDLSTASMLLGRVAEGNIGILRRYGIVLKEGATVQEALAALQSKFGGQAEAYANTYVGAMAGLRASFAELFDIIGKPFLPYLTQIAQGFALLVQEGGPVYTFVQNLSTWLSTNLPIAIKYATQAFDYLRTFVVGIFNGLRTFLLGAWDVIRAIFQTFHDLLSTDVENNWTKIGTLFVTGVKKMGAGIARALANVLEKVVKPFVEGFGDLLSGLLKWISTTYIGKLVDAVKRMVSGMLGTFQNVLSAVGLDELAAKLGVARANVDAFNISASDLGTTFSAGVQTGVNALRAWADEMDRSGMHQLYPGGPWVPDTPYTGPGGSATVPAMPGMPGAPFSPDAFPEMTGAADIAKALAGAKEKIAKGEKMSWDDFMAMKRPLDMMGSYLFYSGASKDSSARAFYEKALEMYDEFARKYVDRVPVPVTLNFNNYGLTGPAAELAIQIAQILEQQYASGAYA